MKTDQFTSGKSSSLVNVVKSSQIPVIEKDTAFTQQAFSINCGQSDTCLVEIFVESMGHINFGVKMQMIFNIKNLNGID